MNIVLTGMMGTGKSAVGRKLADALGMEYVDIDETVEKKTGLSVNDIFRDRGEPEFRRLEKEAVKHAAGLNNRVISTGGGVVKDSANMDALEREGIIVCLTADAATILARTKDDGTRPLLKVADPEKEIRGLLAEREKFYSRCDFRVDTSGKSVSDIAGEIVEYIGKLRE
ncbi:MAG: shikimate kinase [Elusimicrobia bacterium]|nr:shikimate kinase [Elusimicrobiota bacterium]